MNLRNAFLVIAVTVTGCAGPAVKNMPSPIGRYSPPTVTAETAAITGSISRLMLTRTRARIEVVDGYAVREIQEADQPPVAVSAGRRILVVACETDPFTAYDRSDIAVDILANHQYSLSCKSDNLWSHGGSIFSIVDTTDKNKEVATAFGPGRAFSPRGRRF